MGENIFLQLAQSIRGLLAGAGLSPGAQEVLMDLIGILAVLVFSLINLVVIVLLERRISAFIQQRKGPNKVGPQGILQMVADGLKLLGKEDIIAHSIDKWPFRAAAVLIVVPAILVLSVVPLGKDLIVADLDIGLFFFLAVSSVATMAVLMGGWSSNNKYSLIGGMRAVAQMISYEVALVFSLLGVVMLSGSLKMSEIINAQQTVWFILPQFVAFIVYFIAATAELNRAPFDLVEGEQELIGGYFTEYSGMRFAMFMMGEYINMIAVSAIAAAVFLGGWNAPFGLDIIPSWIWYILKIYFMIFLFMWVRWTFPRLRIDHLMHFGWKVLIPVSLVNILVTGVGIYLYRAIGG